MQTLLIVGSGDIARRLLPHLASRVRVVALIRDPAQAAGWRAAGAVPLVGDLDRPASLGRLAGLADSVVHLAPPPAEGLRDTRTRHLLAALEKAESLPRRLVYVSTTGVYGDCRGAVIDETRPRHPESSRARRRVDAEAVLRAWSARRGVALSILRAPGIYAADRLPLERLQRATPVLAGDDDPYTNHIHADDLAAACLRALHRGGGGRVWNVVDDTDLRMGDHFDRLADAFGLPRPPRLDRAHAERVLSPVQWSFLRESRRIGNHRLKHELGLRLAYPTVEDGLAEALPRNAPCSS